MSSSPAFEAILKTKIRFPKISDQIVTRNLLIDRLEKGRNRRVLLICAPAGSGKTTLLSDWLAHSKMRAAWLTLDENDNNPERFFAYLVASIQACLPGTCVAAQAMVDSPQPTQVEPFINSLINEFENLNEPVTLILDDYHTIHLLAIHDAVNYLIDHLPDNVQFVLASRTTPPIPFGRLRARAQLIELREKDLQFSSSEAAEFLNQFMGLKLSNEDIQALETRTEGWVAGLQLAALALNDKPDPSQFIKKFHGSHRFVLDYLIEEVLHQQPVDVQQFLLQTSLLERLNEDLCDNLTGKTDSNRYLQLLLHENLFIVPLDDDQLWYRYHTLFRDLLHYQLEQINPEIIPELHRRASAWYEANGFVPEAVEHRLAAKDIQEAIRLVDTECERALTTGSSKNVIGWLESLPPTLFTAHPQLHLYTAWALITSGQFGRVEEHLKGAEREMAGTKFNPALQADIDATRAIIAFTTGNYPLAIETGQKALTALSKESNMYSSVMTGLGVAYHVSGDLSHAAKTFKEAAQNAEKMNQFSVAISSFCNLGDIYVEMGQFNLAMENFQHGIAISANLPNGSPVISMAYSGICTIYLERNEVHKATQSVQEAIRLVDLWGNIDVELGSFIRLAFCEIASGNYEAAQKAYDTAIERSKALLPQNITSQVMRILQSQYYFQLGQLTHALQILEKKDQNGQIQFDLTSRVEIYLRSAIQIAIAKKQNNTNQIHKALATCEELFSDLSGRSEGYLRLQTLVQKVIALAALENFDQALESLEEALTLAVTEGYVRVFLDLGSDLPGLIQRIPLNSSIYDYAQFIGSAYQAQIQQEPLAHSGKQPEFTNNQDLVEPLSAREIEILRLVTDGLSNQEIASRLVLAPGTVKRHLHNIFGKLDVTTRSQAIAYARKKNFS